MIKITFLGKSSVGKTSLSYKLINYTPENDDPSISENVKAILNINGQNYKVEVIDTCNKEDYPQMLNLWIS